LGLELWRHVIQLDKVEHCKPLLLSVGECKIERLVVRGQSCSLGTVHTPSCLVFPQIPRT
jgi:hypothetical protein